MADSLQSIRFNHSFNCETLLRRYLQRIGQVSRPGRTDHYYCYEMDGALTYLGQSDRCDPTAEWSEGPRDSENFEKRSSNLSFQLKRLVGRYRSLADYHIR